MILTVIGLSIGIFGAVFSALPYRELDTCIKKIIPRFNQASIGIAKLQSGKEIADYDKQLSALNRLLGTNAKKLTPEKNKNVIMDTSTGAVAHARQLIKNEKNETVGLFDNTLRELDRRVRDTRTYIGIGFISLGFILQLAGVICQI